MRFRDETQDQEGIELVSRKINKQQKVLTLDDIPPNAFPRVCELMREPSLKKVPKKLFKIYSMFYINPMSFGIGIWDFILIFVVYVLQVQISLTLGFGPDFWDN